MIPPPPRSTLFPYTTLFRSLAKFSVMLPTTHALTRVEGPQIRDWEVKVIPTPHPSREGNARQDRKSTRLNSSHPSISYAVFCLKKKKKPKKPTNLNEKRNST